MNAAGPGDSRTEGERRMIPSLGAITMAASVGSASYHGLQTTMDKRLSHGWQGSLILHLVATRLTTVPSNSPGAKGKMA